jgi:hypothetical protein
MKLGLVPHSQPACPLLKSLSHFCRKYRPEGRFCRLCRFITTVPSTTCDLRHFLTRKRSIARSRLAIGSLLDTIRTAWAGPTQPARKPVKFVAFLSQIPPSGPFLPVVPVYNHCSVNNLRFRSQHGMEEVVGSIPTRSTNHSDYDKLLKKRILNQYFSLVFLSSGRNNCIEVSSGSACLSGFSLA